MSAAEGLPREQDDQEVEDGRLTLIRLDTSSNRATLKMLSEMMFQFFCGHECYMPHKTWTVFCKVLAHLAYKASRRAQLRARGVKEREGAFVEPQWP